jgi:hypothetical protein
MADVMLSVGAVKIMKEIFYLKGIYDKLLQHTENKRLVLENMKGFFYRRQYLGRVLNDK